MFGNLVNRLANERPGSLRRTVSRYEKRQEALERVLAALRSATTPTGWAAKLNALSAEDVRKAVVATGGFVRKRKAENVEQLVQHWSDPHVRAAYNPIEFVTPNDYRETAYYKALSPEDRATHDAAVAAQTQTQPK
jgi:hypothetical protein